MATTTVTLSNPTGGKVYKDTAASNSAVIAVASGTTVYHIEFDNTANSAVTYLKIYEATSVTLGTTEPSVILKAAAATKEYMSFPLGLALATGLGYVATTTASNSAGSPAAPSNACSLTILYS
jgi:hypothetical protein